MSKISAKEKLWERMFFVNAGNENYSKERKEQAVNDYLAGKDSLMGLCRKIFFAYWAGRSGKCLFDT